MKIALISVAVFLLIMTGCSGHDKITVDKIPPLPAVMIPHLGDTGDLPIEYNEDTILPDDENNGIDAVPDGDDKNWMRITWQHLLDSDLDYLRIYRFDEFNPLPVLIDSISASEEYYIDSNSSLSTNVIYSYFIESVDNAGNSSLSDTVSYGLLSKQLLDSPHSGATIDITYSSGIPDDIHFTWQKSGFVSKFRIIVMDSNGAYLWHRDINVAAEGDYYDTTFPGYLAVQHAGEELYWRVDAFDWNSELEMYIGSESSVRIVTFSGKKH